MMLCKLSLKNIKKSIKDYAIYFFTLILAVSIFYIFNSLESQTAMLDITSSTNEIIELLITLLSGLSVFVSFILGFLIIYASRFLIKKRNKEFAIYMTLGMSKRKISTILLLETIIIGIISLVLGIILGVLISQVTSVFIAKLFDANITRYTFTFSKSATIKSIIYFGIIYIIVMIFNTIIINKCKLIDLINSNKKTEKIKLKNSTLSVIIMIISITMLTVAYYLVTKGFLKIANCDESIMLIPIGLGIIGTILFFFSLSGLILKIVSKIKPLYYKGLNTFIFKQISSKINTMIISMSIICIMLFLTICILATSLSVKTYFNNNLETLAPADFQITLKNNLDIDTIFENNDIKDKLDKLEITNTYIDKKFTLKESLGDIYELVAREHPRVDFDTNVDILTETDYNKIASILNLEEVNIKDNEYVYISNFERKIYDEVMSSKKIININNQDLTPSLDKTINGYLYMAGNPENLGYIVVKDSIITTKPNSIIVTGSYKTKSKKEQERLNEKIIENLDSQKEIDYRIITKLEINDSQVGLAAIVTFIGLYLGIIFLISSAAILALKQLSDSIDDKEKYQILKKLGTDEKQINKSIFTQTLIFFMLPLTLAIIHTIFGIKFASIILSTIGITNIMSSIITTSIILVFIYGGYFLITYICSKNIIK